jgi:ABC-type sugar transport system ATPase subunit
VFLMDEPLSNLDAKLRVQMRSEILRVQQRLGEARGTATLYVTHDQTEAMTMGDRVAVLRAGVLEQYGTPRELYRRPVSLFVASFIGSPAMNLYEGALESEAVVVGSQRIALPGGAGLPGREGLAGLAAYQGRKVIVGVRPEHLVVGAAVGAAGSEEAGLTAEGTGLTADVRLVEALGSEQLVHFTVDAPQVRGDETVSDASRASDASETLGGFGGFGSVGVLRSGGTNGTSGAVGGGGEGGGDRVAEGEILAAPVANGVAVTPPRMAVRAGDRLRFAVDPAALHFFDPDTHLAIA